MTYANRTRSVRTLPSPRTSYLITRAANRRVTCEASEQEHENLVEDELASHGARQELYVMSCGAIEMQRYL